MAVLQSKTPCIETNWHKHQQGYGKRLINGKTKMHHRFVWEEHHGPIPKGLIIRHLCHNTSCVNIDHLAIGTHKDNRQDDIDAGRMNWHSKGEACGASKLTEIQVREILAAKPVGKAPYGYTKALSEKYNCNDQTIRNIWNRKWWGHLP